MLGRHADRIALARRFGATDVVSERGDAAIERVRELTGGLGAHSVLECVGHGESMRTALGIARAGGAVGRVGVAQGTTIPNAPPSFYGNITIAGGPAPVRAYMHELMPDVLDGRIEPGLVFDRITSIDGVPDGYRAMNNRQAIKVMIEQHEALPHAEIATCYYLTAGLTANDSGQSSHLRCRTSPLTVVFCADGSCRAAGP
jgi:threonine dehydrogenase-like Zn-dependent dehydrogenase